MGSWLPGAGGGDNVEWLFNEYRVSLRGDAMFRIIGDGCTAW